VITFLQTFENKKIKNRIIFLQIELCKNVITLSLEVVKRKKIIKIDLDYLSTSMKNIVYLLKKGGRLCIPFITCFNLICFLHE
jgi:AAA15 family ATPase/GTPase